MTLGGIYSIQKLHIVWLLFEGGDYLRVTSIRTNTVFAKVISLVICNEIVLILTLSCLRVEGTSILAKPSAVLVA